MLSYWVADTHQYTALIALLDTSTLSLDLAFSFTYTIISILISTPHHII